MTHPWTSPWPSGHGHQGKPKMHKDMNVAVWDTYVRKKDGSVMHFDIIVPSEVTDEKLIFGYGHQYLAAKGQEGQPLSSRECSFCHVEQVRPQWALAIQQNGYYIYEMENCA